jgi:Uma2 family endonuclease
METNAMLATAAPAEDRVLLRNISWETYERLLAEQVDVTGTHFYYDDGNLEIVVVNLGHEAANRTLARIAEITAVETAGDYVATGCTTFKRDDLEKGFEPDSSFYFRRADEVRGKDKIELPADPPPELIVEVDITSSSLNHFPLYAAIGIAEIWRYDGKRVCFHRLEGSVYNTIDVSVALPPMTAGQATVFVERVRHEKAIDWLRAVRQWIRDRTSTESPA